MWFIRPYKMSSVSAKMLANALNIKRSLKYNPAHNYIEWGKKTDKLSQLLILAQHVVPTVPFTQDIETAKGWCAAGDTVYCRTLLSSHSGKGIVIATTPEMVVNCSLYTKRIRAKEEYRVHLGYHNNDITTIIMQQKRHKQNGEHNYLIKNLDNGYVYLVAQAVPDAVYNAARAAVVALQRGGAVDVLYHVASDKAYVLEVNSAPGLINKATLAAYVEYFRRIIA